MSEKLLCGVDLGGTKLSAALFDTSGTLLKKEITYDHVGLQPDQTVEIIANLLNTLFQGYGITTSDIEGIGVGLAGHILYKEGLVITTSNFTHTMKNYPLIEKLGYYFPDTRILLDNDANVQALGESLYGAGKGYETMVFMTVSTGVGAGIVLNGKLLRGRSGTAGEIGHSIVDYDSDMQCTCGNFGCSMALSSGLFLPELYRRKLRKGMVSPCGLAESQTDNLNGRLLEALILKRDLIAKEIMNDSADIVGTSIFNIFQLLNPECIVLGGGMMKLGKEYFDRIRKRFTFLAKDVMIEELHLKLSEIGADAGLVGSAALLLE